MNDRRYLHWLARSATVVGGALFAALALTASGALADSPPSPPARFAGTVTLNGAPAAPGTTIEALIGSATCGTATVFTSGNESRYALDSPALDPAATPNCGTDGAAVTFRVGGVPAAETGSWKNYQLNILNLTAGGATTPTASPSGSVTARTPGAPVTGSGVEQKAGDNPVLPLGILVSVALFGVSTIILKRMRQ